MSLSKEDVFKLVNAATGALKQLLPEIAAAKTDEKRRVPLIEIHTRISEIISVEPKVTFNWKELAYHVRTLYGLLLRCLYQLDRLAAQYGALPKELA